jgi:hypothetical protein
MKERRRGKRRRHSWFAALWLLGYYLGRVIGRLALRFSSRRD